MPPASDRALDLWGRKVARLPDRGMLLVSTDLQGNLRDYTRMKALRAPSEILLFLGDLVHGPGGWADTHWPAFLGTRYPDQSRELLLDFEAYTRDHRALCLMGNHEHAHVGGPVVSKFHPDEAAVLNAVLGDDRDRICAFLRTFPLIAIGDGLVFVHGAPRATEATLADFEDLDYAGFEDTHLSQMLERGTLANLLWARCATTDQALDLLEVCTGRREGVVVFGHDIVREGWISEDEHQLCLSTSFGCLDPLKTALRVDLGQRIRTVRDLEPGLLRIWPAEVPTDRS